MTILIIMTIGVLIGHFLFPEKAKGFMEKLATCCTVILIFTMGLTLGRRPDFLGELSSLGLKSFLFFIFPTLLSLFIVFFLTKKHLSDRKKEGKGK